MKRRWLCFGVLGLVGTLVALPAALAERVEGDDGKGSAYIALSDAFAMPYVDGELWEDHSFEREGRTLVIENLVRARSYTFEVRPQTEGRLPATLEIGPRCWKLKRIARLVREWRCDRRRPLRFKKGARPAEPAPAVSPAPAPEEDPDVPPMPGVPPPPKPSDEGEE